MKRGRTDEIQFGQPRPQQATGQQRIITTSQPHNAGTAGAGSTIQYQITPNVIKTSAVTPSDSAPSITGIVSSQQSSQLPPQQATSVQYTSSYNSPIGANLIKGQQQQSAVGQQQPTQQQQQVHVVNSTNQVRSTPGHKAAPSGPNSGSTTGTGTGQVIANMSPGVLPGGGSGGPGQQPTQQQQQQGGSPTAPQGQAQLQRLKVEDALSYLDQVKYRFGNQPQVYNDFLDIMKEFKSQSIDTPGVIQRVSNLFKGHPELIVGFNTFLPPGYKIEVQANDQGYAFQVSVSVPSTSTGTSVAPTPSPHKYNTIFQGVGQIVQATAGGGGGGASSNPPNPTSAPTMGVNLMSYGTAGGGHSVAGATTTTAGGTAAAAIVPVLSGTMQQPSSGASAITVNAAPVVAPQNAQPLPTIAAATIAPQMAQNFATRDHRGGDLHHRERTISTGGSTSNASLPTTVTAVVDTSTVTVVAGGGQPPQSQQSIHRMISQQVITQQPTTAGSIVPPTAMVAAIPPSQQQQQQQHHQQQLQTAAAQLEGATGQQIVVPGGVVVPTSAPPNTPTANQPVEFNHAITYVNKIKNRFHSQPEKYKRFLEILHTYQREQKTQKETAQSGSSSNAKQLTEAEVYTQVAKLFDNQEDLLREFGQFLPDATGNHQNQGSGVMSAAGVLHGTNKNHSLSTAHDSPLQHHAAHQQQLSVAGGGTGNVSATGGTLSGGTAVHGSGKKLSNSGGGGTGAGGMGIGHMKNYSSLHSNLIRLQQDRDYATVAAACGDGKDYAIVTPSGTTGLPSGGGVGGLPSRGAGGVLLEKDRNHVASGSGSSLNQKYIHNASMGSLGGSMSGAGNVLPPGLSGAGGSMGPHVMSNMSHGGGGGAIKRSPSYSSQMVSIGGMAGNLSSPRDHRAGGVDGGLGGPPPIKRHKPICRDVSLAEASKYGTLNDYAFFDKVRKALRSPDVYANFLRCLTLFNQEIVSKSDLLTLITPFLSRYPDLLKWFQDFVGSPSGAATECVPLSAAAAAAQRQDRSQNELATDIDLSTCKRLGASYCALPKSHENVKCTGRTSLCRDVLNDTWVSFPTWSEDSTFVTSRKTQYEEFIYRCEDERFELDVVIETNSATIRVLEGVQKRLTRMSQDEISRFRLDDCLGGTSPTIHQRALRRIYGDKAADIIQGLKKNPSVAVPVVLRRMKAKEEEWREAQKSFNKQWREQNEKYYLKSLDHQGINFKQTDIKALRSKSLFNEIETLFDEVSYMKRHEQIEDSGVSSTQAGGGPHMTIPYKDKTILEDAANLLIHHVKRQTGIQKQEKARIKHMLRQFVPDLFFAPRQQLSEDEREEDDKDMDVDQDEDDCSSGAGTKPSSSNTKKATGNSGSTGNSNATGSTTASATELSSSKEECGNSGSSEGGSTTGSKVVGSYESPTMVAPAVNSAGATGASASFTTPTTTSSSSLGAESTNSCSSVVPGEASNSSRNSASGTAATATPESGSTDNQLSIKTEIKDENDVAGGSSQDQGTGGRQPMSPPPLPAHALGKHIEEAYTLFFANNNWYLFLRLHAILCERLRTIYERAQIIAAEERAYESTRNNSTATALRLKPKSEIRIEEYYSTFLEMLKNLLDGNMESSSYEDTLREMFGIHAYIVFTLDRVVQNAVRQLQHCVTERGALECVDLFQNRKGTVGGLCRTANRRIAAELAYQRKAEASLQDENCYKIYIYKIDCRVTIELLDTESEDTTNNFVNSQAYSSYVDRLSNPTAGAGTGSDSGAGGDGATGSSGGGGGSTTLLDSGNARNNHNTNVANSVAKSKVEEGGGTAEGAEPEIKIEKPDDELRHPVNAVTQRQLFLARNLRHFKKCNRHDKKPQPVTIDGKSATDGSTTSWPVVPSDSEDTVSGEDTTAGERANLKVSKCTTVKGGTPMANDSVNSEQTLDSKHVTCNDDDDKTKTGTVAPPPYTTTNATTVPPNALSAAAASAAGSGGGSAGKGTSNMNNNNNINNMNNNSIGSGGGSGKKSDNPLWYGSSSASCTTTSSGKKSSAPERLSSMNGDHSLYIDDTEQLKMDNHFKASKVRNKKYTMYRVGSLSRAYKSHPAVTKRKHRKFSAFVSRWLDRNVSSTQRDVCTDWLLGRQTTTAGTGTTTTTTQSLTTTVVVQNTDLNRTPYVTYKRYKVESAEYS
ncbi:paired amphipathic helix protein Sin3a [Anopheles bellator]|uniref:paired amphipathic helix protein Sin3a n=1 Tax=Anopheles bellator TaxID=139047 RepID=UPI00264A25B3|nr:paired amphipathic helix protein Sin3a [Anopheles bellator]